MEKTHTWITSTMTIGLVGLIIGVGIGYAFGVSRYGVPSMGTHMMSNGTMMQDGKMGSAADQHFIIQMIPHHEGAIDMAKVALERSKRPEIIALSNDIIEAQTKEIANMKSWYQSWYGSTPPQGGMGMHMGGMTGDTTALQTVSAADFDKEFMLQMIPHHEMAIMMGQMIRGSERGEMQQLAENIITSQSHEIELMRGWLREWYRS